MSVQPWNHLSIHLESFKRLENKHLSWGATLSQFATIIRFFLMPQDLSPSRPQPHSSKQPPLLFGPAKKSSGAGAPRVSWVGCNFSSFQRITWRHHRVKTGDGCRFSGYKACNNPRSVYISPIILAIYKHLQWKCSWKGTSPGEMWDKTHGFSLGNGLNMVEHFWMSYELRWWHDLKMVDFFQ